ncbi:unnamed protein product [Dicrocoelium dendriticum]|nr:unnamed protein product [Dicrocoelium dendriticum]
MILRLPLSRLFFSLPCFATLRFRPQYFNASGYSVRRLSSKETYRNRYTHHRNAFPGKPNYAYGVYVTILLCLLLFYSLGGGRYLDTLEARWIEKGRKKRKAIQDVKCETVFEQVQDKRVLAEDNTAPLKKSHLGFRARKFIAYENRIRAYSTPDKIFRYFATLKTVDEDGENIFMTPEDFVRAITPGLKQPQGLELDSFKRFDPKTALLHLGISRDSLFYHLCDRALISFTDFVFLLSVLSTPRRQFEIAFRMFDLNGDGELDADEFDMVRSVILDTTAMGRRHRDNSITGSTLKRRSNSALQQYFFGPDGDQKLTIQKFLQFHAELQNEITRLEFNRASPVDGKITEIQFANILLTYAGFSEQKRRKLIRGVKQKFPKTEENEGITYRDFADFNLLLRSISDVDIALSFHHMIGAPIDQATLKRVATAVANVDLSPHVIDVVFTLFDENNDGHLSYREFVGVMRNRLVRGLDKPMDTGFVRFVNSLYVCTKEQFRHSRSQSI